MEYGYLYQTTNPLYHNYATISSGAYRTARVDSVRGEYQTEVHVAFGDIWCQLVSVGPAPHIYQRGERVREPVCTIHGHYPESTWPSVRTAYPLLLPP